jgi:hypothetical protein
LEVTMPLLHGVYGGLELTIFATGVAEQSSLVRAGMNTVVTRP